MRLPPDTHVNHPLERLDVRREREVAASDVKKCAGGRKASLAV